MDIYNETITFNDVVNYVTDNFIGLLMLLSVFFIIYFVDYICRINSILFVMPSPIPGMPQNITPPINVKKNKKSKK